MLDFYTLRSETKKNIIRRMERISIADSPFEWAWLTYALNCDGDTNDPAFASVLDAGLRWLRSEAATEFDRNLGAIGLLCGVLRPLDRVQQEEFARRAAERVSELSKQEIDKFSRLNDPDIVLGMALGISPIFSTEIKTWFQQHCLKCATGRPRRIILFWASAIEVGVTPDTALLKTEELQVGEIFPALWFLDRYDSLLQRTDDLRATLEIVEQLKDGIVLEPPEEVEVNGRYVLSNSDIAMLYEVLVRRTQQVDPIILFSNFPLHPDVRAISESLFVKQEYVNAVFEAAKLFVEHVKSKSNHPKDAGGQELDGVKLMEVVFLAKSPILKLNSLSSDSERNEQRGFGLMAQGMVSAVRNPKGHKTKATIQIDASEALEQLVMISLLMKRLDQSHL